MLPNVLPCLLCLSLPPSILIHAFISQHLLPCVLYLCVLALGSSMGRWGVQGMGGTHRVPLVILLKDFSVSGKPPVGLWISLLVPYCIQHQTFSTVSPSIAEKFSHLQLNTAWRSLRSFTVLILHLSLHLVLKPGWQSCGLLYNIVLRSKGSDWSVFVVLFVIVLSFPLDVVSLAQINECDW